MFIYVIVCSETLKIYVGQHKKNDLGKYLSQKFYDAHHYSGKRSHIYAAMRRHPRESWSIHPLVSGVESRTELDELEKHFIRVLKTQHPEVGYNICDGGEGFTGTFTEASLRKMSASHLGFRHSLESREKMRKPKPAGHGDKVSAAMMGNKRGVGHHTTLGTKLSEEHKAKIGAASLGNKYSVGKNLGHTYNLGRKHSDVAKENMSVSLMGNKNRLGTKHSEETKAKMRAAQQARRAAERT